MMIWLEKFQTNRILRKHALPDQLWLETTAKLPILNLLNSHQKARLRVLSTLLIYKKTFFGAHNFNITLEMKIVIAAQACLEILELGIDSFEGWEEIIVYPSAFKVERQVLDENGISHKEKNILSGEAWGRGPVIFSWEDVNRDSYTLRPGHNVVIHEFAHKLDMLNGRANGMPPLHPNMPIHEWTESLSKAYQRLLKKVEHHHNQINAYAATNPAEFFAVMCEYYFTAPKLLLKSYPKVYQQLNDYFGLTNIRNK